MSMVCQKDARFRGYEFVCRAMFMRTYSAIGDVSGLDSDCFSSSGCQARRLCGDFGLNCALILISDSKFSSFFSSFVWLFLAVSGRGLDVYSLCGYKGMN